MCVTFKSCKTIAVNGQERKNLTVRGYALLQLYLCSKQRVQHETKLEVSFELRLDLNPEIDFFGNNKTNAFSQELAHFLRDFLHLITNIPNARVKLFLRLFQEAFQVYINTKEIKTVC